MRVPLVIVIITFMVSLTVLATSYAEEHSLSEEIDMNVIRAYAAEAAYHMKWANLNMQNADNIRAHPLSQRYREEAIYHSSMAENYLVLIKAYVGPNPSEELQERVRGILREKFREGSL